MCTQTEVKISQVVFVGVLNRVEEKKLKRLQTQGAKLKPQAMGKFKSNVDNLNAIKPKVTSLFRNHFGNF